MNACVTKPPPKESSAKSPESRRTVPRERSRCGPRAPHLRLDRIREPEREHCADDGHDHVDEQQPLRLDVEERDEAGRQRAGGACERRHGVVGPEEPRRIEASGRAREHGLLQRRERPRLDDLGRHRSRERSEHEQPRLSRERECGARESHDDEERRVPTPTTDAVARASDRDRRERDAGEQCREDEPDLEAGEPAAGERDADEDAAEPIGERAQRLDGEDAAGVGGQAISFRHHA